MTTKEEIDAIFRKWEEYVPFPITENSEQPPKYIPTSKEAGPKPITLEEYRRRQAKNKKDAKSFTQSAHKPKKRGGKKRIFEQTCANLQRIINISKGAQKKKLIEELDALKKKSWRDEHQKPSK